MGRTWPSATSSGKQDVEQKKNVNDNEKISTVIYGRSVPLPLVWSQKLESFLTIFDFPLKVNLQQKTTFWSQYCCLWSLMCQGTCTLGDLHLGWSQSHLDGCLALGHGRQSFGRRRSNTLKHKQRDKRSRCDLLCSLSAEQNFTVNNEKAKHKHTDEGFNKSVI